MCTTCFWNNLHQVGSEPKCLKVKLFKIWESKKTKGPKQNSGRSTLVLIIITWFRIWKFQEKIYVINHVSAEASNTQRTNIYIIVHVLIFIGHLEIFTLISPEWYGLYQLTDSDTENYRSVWCQTHYDISLSHQTCCNTSDNARLNLQNCRYSIYIYVYTEIDTTGIMNINLYIYSIVYFTMKFKGDISSL